MMRLLLFLILCGLSSTVSAEPISLIFADALVRVGDFDAPGGDVADSSSTFEIPWLETLSASSGNSTALTTVDLSGSDSNVTYTLTVQHAFDNSSGSIEVTDFARTFSFVQFTALEDVSYSVSGSYEATGADGFSMSMQLPFVDIADSALCCFEDETASQFLIGTHAIVAGNVGDGNDVDVFGGSLTGTLVAGHEYFLQINLGISNNTAPFGVGAKPVPNNSAAQAVGQIVLRLDTMIVDTDSDGISDDVDNCTLIENTDQLDTNGDGFGNRCDADLNGDCIVNPTDIGLFRLVFLSADTDADFNGDGVVNPADLGILRTLFLSPPGPSGLAACP